MGYLDEAEAGLRQLLGYFAHDEYYEEWSRDVVDYFNKKLIEAWQSGIQSAKLVQTYKQGQKNKTRK